VRGYRGVYHLPLTAESFAARITRKTRLIRPARGLGVGEGAAMTVATESIFVL